MDEDEVVSNLEEQRKQIERELRKRKQAATRALRDEEDRQLIVAGEGPIRAKEKALKDALKRQKKVQEPQGEDGESDGVEVKKQTVTARGLKPTAKKNTTNKATKQPMKSRAASVESDSSSLSDPDDKPSIAAAGTDDSTDEDEDETLDMARMTEKDARKLLDDEVPQDPTSLFDNDDTVEMASARSGHSRHSSLEVSRPPTAKSEGIFDDPEDSSGEDEKPKPANLGTCMQSKGKKTKGLSKRDAALNLERPTVVTSQPANKASNSRPRPTSNVRIESDQEGDESPEEKWPKHARLNNQGALLVQNIHLRAVCCDAIKIVEKTLVTENAWPELHQAAAYKRQVPLAAVQLLVGKDKLYKDILKRITRDDNFVKVIGKWVIDHLSHHRGNIRTVASDHIAIFQLGINDGCKERVGALMVNDVYVYPGEWGITERGQPIWLTKSSLTNVQIYLNPGLIQLMRDAYFATPTAFSYKFKDQYVSSHPSQPEPELTIPLVALGATAAQFFAAIWEWCEGKKPKAKSDSKSKSSERFDGDLFKTVLDRHVETLTALQKKINTYHSIMSKIYSQVTVDNTPANVGTRIQGNALAILDLSGLD